MPSLAENPKAFYDYELIEKYEAGLVLQGFEVKAIHEHMMSLKGSYVKILGGELYLINAHIGAFQPANTPKDYDPTQTRKLLINKKELLHLFGKTQEKGLTLVPLRVYTKGPRIKLEFALARGKKKYDKREKIEKEQVRRDLRKL
ncbi:MAG: SsrA-binding protein SmpB [Patescibacteria group bacterium]|nr:SsrA-binding protein SmpB [Patescibacteria group bacterium]MDE2438211.1 SsrA-binding protein SmpB [Patescibacteria group bacterium]